MTTRFGRFTVDRVQRVRLRERAAILAARRRSCRPRTRARRERHPARSRRRLHRRGSDADGRGDVRARRAHPSALLDLLRFVRRLLQTSGMSRGLGRHASPRARPRRRQRPSPLQPRRRPHAPGPFSRSGDGAGKGGGDLARQRGALEPRLHRIHVGDFESAAKHFAEGTERAPNDYLVWGNLGDALRLLPSRKSDAERAFGNAIAQARAALQVNPQDALIHAHLAEYLAKRGDMSAARKELGIALAAGPDAQAEADILFSAAAVATVDGRKTEAAELLHRAASAGMSATLFTADPQFASLKGEAKFRELR